MPDERRVLIFDTTLRDGEQAPGCSMNAAEKLEVARALEAMGVDVIEAGFPIASAGDFEAVHAIASEVQNATVAGLARALEADIVRAAEAVRPAARRRIHVFCATSEIHRQHKLKRAKDEIVKMSVAGVALAKTFTPDVEFSPEDASRTEREFLVEVLTAVIEAGATTVNIPDTVGYAVPAEFEDLIRYLKENVRNIDQAVVSVHCHDDLGLAVANSLAAVRAGAGQVECTINGIGERAGNASLEEIVMAMRTRRDFLRVTTGIDTRRIYPTSRLVSSITGQPVPRNKAVVGENAFAHESGIHQHGVMAHRECYEIMDPRDIGIPSNKLVLGKHSGRHAFKERLETLGFRLAPEQIDRFFDKFKALADKKKQVWDADIEALVNAEMADRPDLWTLAKLQTVAGSSAIPTATVTLSRQGETVTDAATGDGPVDAVYEVIQRITGVRLQLTDYQLRAITTGADAQGEVTIEVELDGARFRTHGISTDIVEASALAYLAAVNRAASVVTRIAAQAVPAHP